MRSGHRPWAFSAALAAAASLPAAVFAADYDPPIIIEEAPEWVPVEIGSGWYLRGDISYNAGKPVYDFTLLGLDTDNQRFGGGIGFGYHFDDWLRADVNLAYLGEDSFDFVVGEASYDAWAGLLNAYVDLGTISGFTPYLGVGAGVMTSKHSVEIPGLAIDDSKRQNKFAYALNAGIAYRLAGNSSVDVGYQYVSSPDTKYLDTDSFTVKKGVDYHQVRVGLRYDLW